MNITINARGLELIAAWLADHHVSGTELTTDNIRAFAADVEQNAGNGNGVHFELRAHESIYGRPEIFDVPADGFDIFIPDNTFAAACFDQNSIAELETALANPADEADCAEWGLTPEQWRDEIKQALAAKRAAGVPADEVVDAYSIAARKYGTVTVDGNMYALQSAPDHTSRLLPGGYTNYNDASDGEAYDFEMSARAIDRNGDEYTVFWIFEGCKGECDPELDSYDYSIADRVIEH